MAYVHVNGHSRTDNPAPPSKKTEPAKQHSRVQNCYLPKPKDAVKMAQSKPKPIMQKVTVHTVD